MDQRELEANVKQLTKCIAANEPPENALKLLETLQKEARPTEEMLRATRAGVFVGKLRANTNKEIARAASELVMKWKKLVEAEKKAKSSKVASPAAAAAAAAAAATGSAATSSPATTPAAIPPTSSSITTSASYGGKKPFKGDPEKRKFSTDGVDIKRTDSDLRNNCIGVLYNGLAYRSTESPNDVLTRAIAVEAAALKTYRGETDDYKKKIKSLFSNLKNKTNRELGVRVMTGTITSEKFVVMTDEELKSESQRKLDEQLEQENMKNAQVPKGEKSVSDSLECGRCKKKMVSYTQAQTRSADEPMTTFCECVNCGKRWKFS